MPVLSSPSSESPAFFPDANIVETQEVRSDNSGKLAKKRSLWIEGWPPGGGRSIADILEHVAWSKWMYEDYAFGIAISATSSAMIGG